jgi:hypothetical protein
MTNSDYELGRTITKVWYFLWGAATVGVILWVILGALGEALESLHSRFRRR